MKIDRFDEMITTRDNLFYTPTEAGPEGKIPVAGQNYGADNSIKTYKEFVGEFRKGSKQFGKLLNSIMEFLRLPEFKNKIEQIFDDQKIHVIEYLQSPLSLNLIIHYDDKNKAINTLHNLIALS